MKVAVLGWYHQNNAGDDRILYCIQTKLKSLGIDAIEVFVAWDELKSRINDVNKCDFLLVGGGGLILRNTNNQVNSFEKITIPFGLLGVSVDSVGPDNHVFIAYLSKHARFILVRDGFSRDAFAKHKDKDLFLGPDLTFLYPYQNDDVRSQSDSVAVSLRPWKPNLFKQYTKNFHRFNKLIYKFPFLQSMLGLWDIKEFARIVNKQSASKIMPFPLHISEKNGDNELMQTYFDANKDIEFNIDDLKQSEYLIGMRLHSLIFATQLGIPFVAISYASKIDNYLEEIGLSNFVVNVNGYKALPNKIKQLKDQKESISKQLLKTSQLNETKINQVIDTIFNNYIA